MVGTARKLFYALVLLGGLVFAERGSSQAIRSTSPFAFIPNRGQLSDQNGHAMPEVRYTLSAGGVKTYFTNSSIHYVFAKSSYNHPLTLSLKRRGDLNDTLSLYRVDVHFIGANPNAEIVPEAETADYTNYYLPACPNGITHVPGFQKITYKNLYPNIDFVLYTDGNENNHSNPNNSILHGSGNLEYDFIVHPGGDPSAIQMQYDHASSLFVDEDGTLHLASPYGTIADTKPNGYQLAHGGTVSVSCGFQLTGNDLAIHTGPYDRARDLTIDPQRLWGTYFGWEDTDNFTGISDLAVDRSGNADLYGYTNGTANIATSGAYQTTYGGGAYDCFIAKFGPNGNLLWSTYYGGSGDDYSGAIACDTSGGILIAGYANGTAFLGSFNNAGSRRWGTNYGSNSYGWGVAVDSAANIIFTGTTNPFLVPVKMFIVKFSPQGSQLWASFLRGTDSSENMGYGQVCADVNNNIYISGTTAGTKGIATTGAYQTSYGPSFFAKYSPSGSLVWATYYLDSIYPPRLLRQIDQIAVSRSGNLYFVGCTTQTGLATSGAYQTAIAGDSDAIIGKFNTNGKRVWVTYYGGDSADVLDGITLDTAENIFACGETHSAAGIATAGEYQTALLGPYNPFMVKFDSGGRRKWGTYYGRRGWAYGIGLDPQGHPLVGGRTETGTDEYASSGAFDGAPYGSDNAFLAKFCDPMELTITSNVADTICPGTSFTLKTKAGLASYQWLSAGNPINGATSQSYSFTPPNTGKTYYYTVTGEGTDMCDVVSDTLVMVVRQAPTIIAQKSYSICPGSSMKLPIAAEGTGHLNCLWVPDTGLDHPDSLQPTASPTHSTSYTLTVTDATGCSTSQQITVALFSTPKLTLSGNHSICVGSSLPITVSASGGIAPFHYAWEPSGTLNRTDSSTVIATPTAATTYTVAVTDFNGCVTTDSITITLNPVPTAKTGPPLSMCRGSSVALGLTMTGGTAPYSYQWEPTTNLSNPNLEQPIASPDTTTLYRVTVTDFHGCTAEDSVLVTVADSLEPTIQADGPTTFCAGDSVTLDAGTGYASYAWSNGETSASILVKKSGTYSVHVTNGLGCAGTSNVLSVSVLPDSIPHPVLTASATHICDGDSVKLGTTQSYASYQWSTGDTTPTIFVSKSDSVSVLVTNPGGCSGTSSPIAITVYPVPTVTITSDGSDTLCFGDSLLLSATSGYAHYAWSTGDSTRSILINGNYVSAAGNYSVTATNAVGCSATSDSLTITLSPTLNFTLQGPTSVCPGDTATYTAISGGILVGEFFQWILPLGTGTVLSGTPLSQTILWKTTGTATLTLLTETQSGCSFTDSIHIRISSTLEPTITGPIAFCTGDSITLDAGAGYASYQWSENGNQIEGATQKSLVVNQSGIYTVYVTSAGGCSGTSAPDTVTEYPTPSQPMITRVGSQLESTPAAQYQWSFNGSALLDSTARAITPTMTGYYAVTITDTNGCTSTSAPFLYSNALWAAVSIGGKLVAQSGSTVTIPILLDSSNAFAQIAGTPFTGTVGLDATMLTPISPAGALIGNEWQVPIAGSTPNASGTLQTITALALDSGFCSQVTIDTLYFPSTPSVSVTTSSGLYCVTGVCTPILSTTDTAFFIKNIIPNPTNGSFSFVYHVADAGPVTISLQDELGRVATTLKNEWATAGDYNEAYSLQTISSGLYRIILRSGGRTITAVLIVEK